jgi:GNAT superfamily N-acetyltransferase
MTHRWREEPVASHHDRKGFDCGEPALNAYLHRFARQNHESGGAKTFVAVAPSGGSYVLGYYTVSPGAVAFARVPGTIARGLGRYELPVFRLGRLAVSRGHQGQGLGSELLFACAARCLAVAAEIGGVALAIDAKDVRVAKWYARFGAVPLLDDPLRLLLPLDTVGAALRLIQLGA